MAPKLQTTLSAMEAEAVEKIRRLRAQHRGSAIQGGLQEEAAVIHDLLRGYRGNVKLRLKVITAALGCTTRTLRRAFVASYGETMNSFHEKERIEYAERVLSFDPDIKLMSIAAELGYDRESEFNRFFRRKKGVSLTEYVREVRLRQEKGDFSNDPTLHSGQK